LPRPRRSRSRPRWAQETLVVYWTKGFYPQEDKALDDMIAKFQQKTQVKVELSRYSPQESVPKASPRSTPARRPTSRTATCSTSRSRASGRRGRLEDLSDILLPMKANFLPVTLETVYLLNEKTKQRAYYAFPMKRQTMHIQYWKDMLAEAGYKESDIPQTWNAYWDFWCTKAQAGYRKKSGKRIFSVGSPMGVDSSDSFYSFLTYMDAYNVKVVDDSGKLLVDQPEVKKGLVAAVKDYASTIERGCTPPSAVNWKDPDNNVAFHNKQIMMTHNATISIAAKWLDDANNDKLTPEQRAEAKTNYYEKIATAGFPMKPDGKPMVYRSAVKVGVVFANAKNKKRAKEFVQFAMQDENLIPYVEGALGRWYPVTKSGASRPFWTDDPHRKIVHNQFSAGTVPFEFTKNYKFTILNNENVWAKAINRVANDKWSPEKAVDEMIARIKQVAG
jgi:multiple sugar transport system substrate-binding protein